MTLRVGSLVYATDQGLGYLAKSFYDNGVLTDVMMIAHGSRPMHQEWYPGHGSINSLRSPSDRERIQEFCHSVDVMVFFETPFIWELIPFCQQHKIGTVLIPMYECMPRELPHVPDKIISPSLLDQQYYPSSQFINIPAPNPQDIPWRLRSHAQVFVHNAGHGGLKGRNGTAEVLEALEYIESPAKVIIRSQESLYQTANHRQVAQLTNPLTRKGQELRWGGEDISPLERMLDIRSGTVPRSELYAEGDCLLFPERFNGLSLPLQEAYSAGMMVMCGKRFPMTEWLPKGPMIEVKEYVKECVSPRCHEYDSARYDPREIARNIDLWYGQDISTYSNFGRIWGEMNSWQILKPKWMEAICNAARK